MRYCNNSKNSKSVMSEEMGNIGSMKVTILSPAFVFYICGSFTHAMVKGQQYNLSWKGLSDSCVGEQNKVSWNLSMNLTMESIGAQALFDIWKKEATH